MGNAATVGDLVKPRQARFAAEYVKDLNATQAAIRAGYSAKTAGPAGARLLKSVNVQAAIQAYQAKAMQRVELDAAGVLLELARIASFDISTLYDDDGNPKPMRDWPAGAGKVVAGLEIIIKNAKAGDGITDRVLKLRTWDKNRALDTLAKHFGLLVDASINVNVNASLEQVAGVLQAARKRHAAAIEGQ